MQMGMQRGASKERGAQEKAEGDDGGGASKGRCRGRNAESEGMHADRTV